MATADVTQAARGAVNGEIATACAACPHPWTLHDPIAARYCTASAARKLSRGCVCTAAHVDDVEHQNDDEDT